MCLLFRNKYIFLNESIQVPLVTGQGAPPPRVLTLKIAWNEVFGRLGGLGPEASPERP